MLGLPIGLLENVADLDVAIELEKGTEVHLNRLVYQTDMIANPEQIEFYKTADYNAILD